MLSGYTIEASGAGVAVLSSFRRRVSIGCCCCCCCHLLLAARIVVDDQQQQQQQRNDLIQCMPGASDKEIITDGY